jgi:4-hydroxybenzoate polyprenyltransferase
MNSAFKKIKVFFELVKFEHTAFALPFAYLGMLLADKVWPSWGVFFWVTLAMVSARTTGMTLNRLVDLGIDGKNPRTQNRPLLTGEFPVWGAWVSAAVSLVIFFVSAWRLNPLCFRLSWLALALLSTYHFVKRFSFLCHFALGLVLASAPMGGWLAVTGSFSWIPVFLSLAVLFWVAGFDILYSLQDADFDRAHGLHSIPVRFGEPRALKLSGACHALAVVFLILFGWFHGLGVVYWAGVAVVAALLGFEHVLVADGDKSKINTAFFNINGWIGVLLLVFTVLEIFR